jgi:hypothetical protein
MLNKIFASDKVKYRINDPNSPVIKLKRQDITENILINKIVKRGSNIPKIFCMGLIVISKQ